MKHTKQQKTYSHEALMRYARMLGFGEVHTKIDPETGLHAIIAIHSNKLGPAIGGCRFKSYSATGHALKDALNLAFMMTLKAAVSNLPHGGAKSVIIKPAVIRDHDTLFRSFGDFVHEMNGRYIAAMDYGTKTTDMDIIAERTPYVIGATKTDIKQSNPAPHTAYGVIRGIQAAVKFKLGRDDLDGLHVVIQGAGGVGYELARILHNQGALLTMTDPKIEQLQRCVDEFKITAVDTEAIYDVPCDVFSPCALGGTINHDTLHRLKTPIVAGSANNQLANRKYADVLRQKNILYAPDFVINAGGLINAALVYDYHDSLLATQLIAKLYDTLIDIFERAERENLNTEKVAERMALEKLGLHPL